MPNQKEYLAKKSLLDTKQDVLTPGDNITITNNRISAQVPVVDVLVNNQSVIGQDNIARVVVDTVDANPAQTPTDTLTSIDINGTVYELQGGGGGSDVIPNPQGEPTDTLETIEIDGTVFDIAGSGGSSGKSRNLINQNITATGTVILNDSIENYDFIMIELTYLYGDGYPVCGSTIASVDYLKNNYNSAYSIWVDGGNNDRSCCVAFSDGVTMHVKKASITDAITGVYGLNLGIGVGSEIIPISAGDGTTSRTFTFDKIPKKISMQWTSLGWTVYRDIIWGTDRSYYQASQVAISDSATYVGVSGIVCDETTKSITITGLNALQASNTADIVGYMFVDYGGGSGGSSEPDISDMTWTAIASTSYGQSTAAAIPQGTKELVLTAEYNGIVTKVAEEKIENIQKLLDTSLQNTWNMGAEYADTAGNHTFVAMSVNNNLATAYSGYSGVIVKIYALS